MAGTPLKNLDMFKKLRGVDVFHKAVLVTMMWRDVDPSIGRARQTELQRDYWAGLANKGSKIMPFEGTRESAWAILDPIIARESDKRSIRIQKELVDLKKDLRSTAAGQQLYGIIEMLVEKQQHVLGRLREELNNTTDSDAMAALTAELNGIQRERKKAIADMRRLDTSIPRRVLNLFRH